MHTWNADKGAKDQAVPAVANPSARPTRLVPRERSTVGGIGRAAFDAPGLGTSA